MLAIRIQLQWARHKIPQKLVSLRESTATARPDRNTLRDSVWHFFKPWGGGTSWNAVMFNVVTSLEERI